MTFVKSIMSNKSTQIYFDMFDNKHIRKNGSLAWRCNNPGLVHSHSNIASKHGAIGNHGQYHVFPNINIGRQALISWVKLKSYYSKPLLAIAESKNPNDPTNYLSKLCALSNLEPIAIPSKLTDEQFKKLIWAIEELAGGHAVYGNESFYQLPKIIGRFISRTKKVDHYLIADGRILSKAVTIEEVKAEKIDAVIVHQSDGSLFLRSRPGHVLSQIYVHPPVNNDETGFKNFAQEDGKKREGQVIWGFINGIINTPSRAQRNLTKMVEAAIGEQVWGFLNATGLHEGYGFPDALSMTFGCTPEIVSDAIEYFKYLVMLSDNDPKKPPIVVVAHSEGAFIAEVAARQMNASLRKRIQFWTLGGAGLVPDGVCSPGTRNFINQYDLIIRAVSSLDYRLLIIRDQCKGKSYDYIADSIAEQDALVRGMDEGAEYEFYKKDKSATYKKRLEELSNTEIIYRKKGPDAQHAFEDVSYQKKLKELISQLYEKK
jgi:hypothetical protein